MEAAWGGGVEQYIARVLPTLLAARESRPIRKSDRLGKHGLVNAVGLENCPHDRPAEGFNTGRLMGVRVRRTSVDPAAGTREPRGLRSRDKTEMDCRPGNLSKSDRPLRVQSVDRMDGRQTPLDVHVVAVESARQHR